jgi:hypothetical protein
VADNRIKGQEVAIRITRQGRLEAQITAIKDCTLNLDSATIEEGYLNETSNRFDDVVNGASGSFGVTNEGPELLRLVDFISQRAQRRITGGDLRINLTGRFSWPDGRRARMMFSDLKFDQVPIAMPGRAEYVTSTFSFKCSPPKLLEG